MSQDGIADPARPPAGERGQVMLAEIANDRDHAARRWSNEAFPSFRGKYVVDDGVLALAEIPLGVNRVSDLGQLHQAADERGCQQSGDAKTIGVCGTGGTV